jgi:hypothetical protein
MLQKKRFGDDCAGTAGSHGPDRRDDQMNYQDEPIPHTANDDRAGRTLQGYEAVANCGRLSIRHGQPRFARSRAATVKLLVRAMATKLRSSSGGSARMAKSSESIPTNS